MRDSVLATVVTFLSRVLQGAKSTTVATLTSIPYLFNWGDAHREVTEQYPDPISSRTPDDLPPRSRGILFNDIDRCTGCLECDRACPTKSFRIENDVGPDGKTWVARFDIDFASCVFCGLCVEVCPPASLIQTKQYEGSVYNAKDLTTSFGRGQVTPEQRAKWAAARSIELEGDYA
jgi:formate hydrogenlyase subunit 6/NADH:ubiquinone oxidoreductase subunit I